MVVVLKVALLEAPGADPADVFSRWCKSGPRQPEASRAVRTDGVLVNHHVVLEMWNVPGLKSKLFDARSKRRRQAIEGTHVCALVVGSSFLSQPNSLPLLGKLRREILNAKIPGTDGMEFALLITKQKSDIPVSAETLSKFCRDQSVAGWVSVSVGGTRTTLREALRYIASVGVKVHEARTGLKEGSFSAGIAAATRRRCRLRERLQQSLARVLAAGDGTTSMALPRTFTGREPVIVLPHVLSGRKSKKKKRRASVPASARTSARASARRGSPLLNDTDPADHSVVIANTVRQFLPSSSPSSYGPRTSLTPVPGTNPVPSAAKKPRAVKVRASKSLKTTRPRARPARKKVSGTACASSRSTKTGSQNESASTVGRPRSTEKRRVGADTAGVRRASTGARSRHRRKNSGLKSSAGDSLTIQRSRSDSGIARLATVGKLPEVRRTVVRGGEKRRSSLLSTPQAETSSSSQAPGPQASTPPARQSVAPTLALGGMAAGQANDAATLRDADSKGVGASTEEEAEMEELDALLRLQWSRVVHTVRSVRADHKQFKTLIDQFQNPTWRSIAPRLFNALRGGEPNVAFATYRGAVMALTGTNGEAPRLIFRVFDERARGYLTREDAREAYEEFFLSSSVAEKLLKLGDDLDKIRNRLRGSIEKAVDRMFGRLDPMRTGFIREEAFIDSYAEVDVLPSFETAALRG